MSFAPGALVTARDREWVVLPESNDDLLVLRPLGGTDDEVTGILPDLEEVRRAAFDLPDAQQLGDHRSCRLLRDAVRLGFRSSAGPFRSFGRLAVSPRPYQLVPLIMALKLDPVRMLVADDVGIGKTVEACLIARELLDRGEIQRLAVLCPPHLAEQWQTELRTKFHIEAELVLSSTAARLERATGAGVTRTIFDFFPFVIVSTEFIKNKRRLDDFARSCPEFVIVDEAHGCAAPAEARGTKHDRHALLKALSANQSRHLVLVTATPHSGNAGAFRSLLSLLKPDFANLPDDLRGKDKEPLRRHLAQHFVQRRRGDIRHFMGEDTPFPTREPDPEPHYKLSPDYKKLFERVLAFARETVRASGDNHFRQRVRWWAALGLLRALASSPAAAAETLRTRAASADTETASDADEIGRNLVLDITDDQTTESADITPGADIEADAGETSTRRRLLEMARAAEALRGDKDAKLIGAVKLLRDLLADGFNPIVFCRFIPTAEYLETELRQRLPGVEIIAVTSRLAPEDREAVILRLIADAEKPHILVATDCLSEGVNLQHGFNAVLHYDLSWSPTRHEQREGRVDRYQQPSKTVRVFTYYGLDNQIDGLVLDILLRKHRNIRRDTEVSIPMPKDSETIGEAIFEGLLLRQSSKVESSEQLALFEDFFTPIKTDLHRGWDASAEREKQSRNMFKQAAIDFQEVGRELDAIHDAIGSDAEAEAFLKTALAAHGGLVREESGALLLDLAECPLALREAVGGFERGLTSFSPNAREGVLRLQRNHPFIEGLAAYVMSTALDPLLPGVARRTGVVLTRSVTQRTVLLLLRLRFHIITRRESGESTLLAEDSMLVAFEGTPSSPQWLAVERASALLDFQPDKNITPDLAAHQLSRIVEPEAFAPLWPQLETFAAKRGEELLDAHRRVRLASNVRGVNYRVEPAGRPDVLGVTLYQPAT